MSNYEISHRMTKLLKKNKNELIEYYLDLYRDTDIMYIDQTAL